MKGNKVSTFASRFALLCQEHFDTGSTQQDIADILGVSRQTVGAWASGERSPKRPTVEVIANKFNVSLAWINGFDVERSSNGNDDAMAFRERVRRQPSTRMLLDATKDATEEEMQQYIDVIKALRKTHDE